MVISGGRLLTGKKLGRVLWGNGNVLYLIWKMVTLGTYEKLLQVAHLRLGHFTVHKSYINKNR